MKDGIPPPGLELLFRPAAIADLAFCYLTYADGMRPPVEQVYGWDEDHRREIFASVFRLEESKIIEARIGSMTSDIGWMQVEEEAEGFHVKELHIVRASRNLGLGAWALSQILEAASAARKDVRLSTFRVSPAVRFYQRMGFHIASQEGDVVSLARPYLEAAGS